MTDSAVADHAAPDAAPHRTSRRALLGAGAIGAAVALVGTRPASASAGRSDDDRALLDFAISFELAARDLYDEAVSAGATGSIWELLSEQHESYAQLLAGIAGAPADGRNDTVFDTYTGGFRSSTRAAAFEFENIAAATHTDLLQSIGDDEAAGGIASIAAMESRHAAVLAGIAGMDDPVSLFLNTAAPLVPEV